MCYWLTILFVHFVHVVVAISLFVHTVATETHVPQSPDATMALPLNTFSQHIELGDQVYIGFRCTKPCWLNA